MYLVLYVDDEPELLEIGKVFLEKSGILAIDTAISGEEAIKKMEDRIYDGIIADYMMPGMDGIELLKYIRSSQSNIPYILFTGRGREEVVIEALNSGADFYLQKGGDIRSQFIELEHKIRIAIERRRIEEKLRLSEDKYRKIFEMAANPMQFIGDDSTILLVNREFEKLSGYSRDELEGIKSWIDFVADGDDIEIMKEYGRKRKNNPDPVSPSYEFRFVDRHGNVRNVIASVARIPGESQTLAALLDITERKSAEEELRQKNDELNAAYEELTATNEELIATEDELRKQYEELKKSQHDLEESEHRYRNVVEDQNEFICRFDGDGRILFVNGAYCRYFGKNREELLGRIFKPDIPREDLGMVKSHFDAITPDHPVSTIEHRICMPDGKYRWQQWSNRGIFDKNGNLVEYQSVGRDITNRRVAEDELNAAYEELTATNEELIATEDELRRQYEELKKSQYDLEESERRYRNVVEDQNEYICRFDGDGRILFVNEAYCRYFGKNREELIGNRHVLEIPPEDHQMVADSFDSITPLNPVAVIEHRSIMPNGEIRWQQWSDRGVFDEYGNIVEFQSVGRDVTDRRMAEEALAFARKKLNLLNSVILNEIQNLTFSMLGIFELRKDIPDDEASGRNLQKEINIAHRLMNFLNFGKTLQDLGISPPRWQNVSQCFLFGLSHVDMRNISRNIAINGIEIFADPLLEKVFFILAENSVRHGIKVTGIELDYVEKPEGIVITYTDNGIGVPEDLKEKIFEKLYGKNKGMSLFLAREILGITGISIQETGEHGKGSKFEMVVPREKYRLIQKN